MNAETLIRAWKDPKFRSTLDTADLPPHPAGERLIDIDDAELRAVWKLQTLENTDDKYGSEGYVCTVSSEDGKGGTCWSTHP